MPLLERRETPHGFIAVWETTETTEVLRNALVLSPEETLYFRELSGEKRRKEWLAWHGMIRHFLGEGITAGYHLTGAPRLLNHSGHISVSHSAPYVTLYYSPHTPCGIDIEDMRRDFSRVARRTVSDAEEVFREQLPEGLFLPLSWCVKEAAYKYAGIPGLDFQRDIRITDITHDEHIRVRLREREEIRIGYFLLHHYCLAYTL